MKLGTRLLRDGVIGLSELEAALRAQVLYGGRLGTNLVELGFLDIDTVCHFVALACGAPEATRDRFERTPQDAIDGFGAELARAELAFPLGAAAGEPSTAAVAVLDSGDEAKRQRLAEALGQPVALYVAAEMRLYYYLEKHFGIERSMRYVRASSQPREQGKVERRRLQGAPRVLIEPRNRSGGSRISAVKANAEALATTAPAAPAPPRDVGAVAEDVAAAEHRDQIGQAMVSFAPGRLEALAVLLIRDRTAMGWCGYSATASGIDGLDQLSVPLTELSSLKLAYDANEVYWGPPPEREGAGEARLWVSLGLSDIPERVLIAPISVRDRVVNLIAAVGAPISVATRSQLSSLAAAAGDTYLKMIRSKKR